MAVIPQFTPGGPAGQLAEENMSWMDRAQQRKLQQDQLAIQQAEEARRQQQYEILQPVIAAKARSDILSAQDQIDAAKGIQDLRAEYLPLIKQARKEFGALGMIKNSTERAEAANTWIGQYAPIASLGEFEKEFGTYLHHATGYNMDDMKLNVLQQTLDARTAASETRAKALLDVAQLRADTTKEVENLRGAHAKEQQELRNASAELIARSRAQSNDPVSLNNEAMSLDQEAETLAATNPMQAEVLKLSAKQLRDKAVKITSPKVDPFAAILDKAFGVQTPSAAAGQAAPKPAAVAPQQLQDLTKGIKF